MKTVRWGIIGCGDVTEVKSGPGFQKAAGSRLVAVMRRDAGKAQDYARRHGVPRWYVDAEALLRDPEVDAVYIATPPGSHLELALQACAAGKPVLVEKPMARSAAECRRMIAAFQAAGLPLYVAFYRRALPRFLRAAELVASGRLGRITQVRYRLAQARHRDAGAAWRVSAEQSGGGHFFDLGSHTLDILDFILGPLEDVRGAAAHAGGPGEVEESVVLTFRTTQGALGTASWNFASGGPAEDGIEITGSRARLTLSTFGTEPLLVEEDGRSEHIAVPHPDHVHQPLIQTIVHELQGAGRCPSTGSTALRTAVVMDAVTAEYYGGRADAFWRRPDTWPGRRPGLHPVAEVQG